MRRGKTRTLGDELDVPTLPNPADFAIRPWIRVLGAIFVLGIAYIFVDGAISLFQADQIVYGYRSCGGKGRLLCELGNLVASLVPTSIRGVVEAASGLLAAGLSMYIAWLLLKPVVRSDKNPDAP